MSLNAAIFLDRDGTLIEERHHLHRIEDIVIIPGAVKAVRRINAWGGQAVVITNQSAVARGLLTEAQLAEIHDTLRREFARRGAHLDGIYYCPHHPEAGSSDYTRTCGCRKPQPGLLLQAQRDLGINLSRSTMIGDTLEDVAAGQQAGCRAVLVRTGYGPAAERLLREAGSPVRPDQICDDVLDAVNWALEDSA